MIPSVNIATYFYFPLDGHETQHNVLLAPLASKGKQSRRAITHCSRFWSNFGHILIVNKQQQTPNCRPQENINPKQSDIRQIPHKKNGISHHNRRYLHFRFSQGKAPHVASTKRSGLVSIPCYKFCTTVLRLPASFATVIQIFANIERHDVRMLILGMCLCTLNTSAQITGGTLNLYVQSSFLPNPTNPRVPPPRGF